MIKMMPLTALCTGLNADFFVKTITEESTDTIDVMKAKIRHFNRMREVVPLVI
jgi:hypothetical protein